MNSCGSTHRCVLPFCLLQMFECKSDLMLHSQQIHKTDPKPYKCELCPKSFANSSYLSQHNRIHAGIKPYKCQICERKFTQLCHLQQHLRTHTGEKPYRCQYAGCPKAFSQLSNLQSHSRSHMTDKPYRCNSCYKCFSSEQELREHIPKHSETKHLKTHICQECGKSYTQETYLTRHMQKHAITAKDHRARSHLGGGGGGGGMHHKMHNDGLHNSLNDVLQAHHQQQQSPHMQLPMQEPMPLNLNHNQGNHHIPSIHNSDTMEKSIRDSLIQNTDTSKMSAFAPLAHQLSSGMINSSLPSNYSFPPTAHLTSSPMQHLSSMQLGSSRYFFDGIGLGGSSKRDSSLDRSMGPLDHSPLDRDRSPIDRPLDMARDSSSSHPFLNLQQMRYKTPSSSIVFPKNEPSSPVDKDFNT